MTEFSFLRNMRIFIIVGVLMLSLGACQSSQDIEFEVETDDVSTFRGSDGKIVVKTKGISNSFEYSIDNGETWSNSNTFKSLSAGLYRIKIRNKGLPRKTSQVKYVMLSQPEAKRPEVYVGVADQRLEQLNNPDKWKFVRENADGFYINFIMLDSIYSQKDLNKFAELFTNKNAFIESDMNSTMKKEQGYIDRLHKAGFRIPYTSLNYGWEKSRHDNLKTYNLLAGQEPRLCLVQHGPWVVGGDITKDNGKYQPPRSNEDYRSWIVQSDGVSTDGPMGFWYSDENSMKSGSYSMVKFARSLGKKSLVMICPYHADVKGYNPNMYLEVGMQCVREHEDNDAEPDIWSVFEYATSIAAVPEEKDGKPFNSTTGMAYYLINHILGVPDTLSFTVGNTDKDIQLDASVNPGTMLSYEIEVKNTSDWCDYAAGLKANIEDLTEAWDVRFMQGDKDVTNLVLSGSFQFYKEHRLNPQSTQKLTLVFTRTNTSKSTNFTMELFLSTHLGVEGVQSIKIIAK